MIDESDLEPTRFQRFGELCKDFAGEGVSQVLGSIIMAPFKAVAWLVGSILDGL